MNIDVVISTVVLDFAERYSNFAEFSTAAKYKPVWDICVETIKNEDYLKNIRFCNDYYNMPPVRVFIDINRKKLDELARLDEDEELFTHSDNGYLMKSFLKQSMGAFWGMVFRYGLSYDERKTVGMVKDKYYGIATASRFVYKHPAD